MNEAKSLIKRNKSFVSNKNFEKQRSKLTTTQHPEVVLVSCSDSRLDVSYIFDLDLGQIFEIRTAGQVLTSSDIESIKYALDHLHVKIIIVMGHTNCGAVTAAVNSLKDDKIRSEYPTITSTIIGSVEKVYNEYKTNNDKLIYNSVIQNAIDGANRLSYLFPDVTVIPFLYDVKTGKVCEITNKGSTVNLICNM